MRQYILMIFFPNRLSNINNNKMNPHKNFTQWSKSSRVCRKWVKVGVVVRAQQLATVLFVLPRLPPADH